MPTNTKWNLPADMTPEEKRKARRQLRARVAAGEENPTYDPNYSSRGSSTNGSESTPTTSNQIRASKGTNKAPATTSALVTTDPEDDEEDDDGDDEGSDEDPHSINNRLARYMSQNGLQQEPNMSLGYGFQVMERNKQGVVPFKTLHDKFFARWGKAPETFRVLTGGVVILGPLPG